MLKNTIFVVYKLGCALCVGAHYRWVFMVIPDTLSCCTVFAIIHCVLNFPVVHKQDWCRPRTGWNLYVPHKTQLHFRTFPPLIFMEENTTFSPLSWERHNPDHGYPLCNTQMDATQESRSRYTRSTGKRKHTSKPPQLTCMMGTVTCWDQIQNSGRNQPPIPFTRKAIPRAGCHSKTFTTKADTKRMETPQNTSANRLKSYQCWISLLHVLSPAV